MRILHHHPVSAYARKVRLALAEKRLAFELFLEKPWERRPEYLALNPAGTVPTLVEDTGLVIPDSGAICEYLEEAYPDGTMLGQTHAERAEVRSQVAWFDQKFAQEVTFNLAREKLHKRLSGVGGPDASALRAGYHNLHNHLIYIGWLAENRKWLAGAFLSYADLAAAAHLSVLDFTGDVDWSISPAAKEWYARIKSRPSFRPLLADNVPGVMPPPHYSDLDF